MRNPPSLIDRLQDGSKRRPRGPKRPLRWPQDASKRLQEAAMRAPRGPMRPPRWPHQASKMPQEADMRLQEAPKRLQEASKRPPRRPKRPPRGPQEAPRGSQEASKRHPNTTLMVQCEASNRFAAQTADCMKRGRRGGQDTRHYHRSSRTSYLTIRSSRKSEIPGTLNPPKRIQIRPHNNAKEKARRNARERLNPAAALRLPAVSDSKADLQI